MTDIKNGNCRDECRNVGSNSTSNAGPTMQDIQGCLIGVTGVMFGANGLELCLMMQDWFGVEIYAR